MRNATITSTKSSEPLSNLELILIALTAAILILAAGLLYYQSTKPSSSAYATAPLAVTDIPVQRALSGEEATPFYLESTTTRWTLTPRASYQISARVLGNKSYSDGQAVFAPRDLALAWGELSDPAVDEWISWRQSSRWYQYSWPDGSPYSGDMIRNNSANVHIIPASENLARALQNVGKEEVVYMAGQLVDIDAVVNSLPPRRRGGRSGTVNTSLTRADTGKGACEILYVEQLIVNEQLYE